MKKKCMILLVIFIILFSNKVKGSSYTLSISHEDNYFFSISGNGVYMSNRFPYYYIDGEVAYCIEPGKQITTWGYLEDANLPFSEEIIKKLELISRYGYLYPGHNTNLYHMATQMLMWYLTTDKAVELRDQQYGYGNLIDIEKEKNEIMRLVNNHYTKPSFDNNSYDILYDNELVIKDNSNVLDMYIVKDNDGNEVNIVDNELHINSKKIGKSKIILEKKKYDNKATMIFKGDDNYSQKQAILRNNDLIESIININTYGARIKVNKIDSETKQIIKKKGIKFKIKNNDNGEYLCENSECIFETNDEGYFILNKYLLGNYSIYEVEDQMLDNYLWNKNKLDISITKDTVVNSDNIYSVNFTNERVKGKIIINKIGEKLNDDYTYDKIHLKDVKYGVYANDDILVGDSIKYKKNDLVGNIITDSNGQGILDNLEIGKYYIKELSSSNDNIIDKNIYEFEIKYKDKYTKTILKKLSFNNYLPKGNLEFIKLDSNTNKPIKDTLIEVYYNDDLFYKGYTDELGKIILNDIPLGTYYLKEVESSNGYINNNEVINFKIDKDKQYIKLSMTNDMIIEVPNTFLFDYKFIELIGLIIIFLSIGGIIYDKTQKK